MWLSSEYAYANKFILRTEHPGRSMWRRLSGITSMKAVVLSIGECRSTRSMVKFLSPIPNCSLLPRSWKDGWKLEILCSQNLRSLNITHSHSQGNLFPSRKLKGSHTFTTQSTVVEDLETEEGSGPKLNGEKETESSTEEDVGMLGEVGNVDPSLGYIVWFTNAVELYQKKNCNCFGCGSLDHLVKDCPEDLEKLQGR